MTTSAVDSCWADVVLAMLSVNNYPVDRTFQHLDELAREGILNPMNLAKWDATETTRRLATAGYDRGEVLTPMMAERLMSLGRFVQKMGREHCEAVLLRQRRDEISALLDRVPGVGPAVLRTLFMLREAK